MTTGRAHALFGRPARLAGGGLVVAALWAAGGPAVTQSADTGSTLEMDTVVVTGTPVGQDVFTSPADLDVLTGESLAAVRGAGLGQTLQDLPDVNFIGSGEQVGLPVIRGLSGQRVRVLENGIGLNFQQFGLRHPPNLDPFMAQRIEVVRGPASLLYGSDALGGVVNVITGPPAALAEGQSALGGSLALGWSSAHETNEAALTLEGGRGGLTASGTLVLRDARNVRTPEVAIATLDAPSKRPLVSGELPFTDYTQTNGQAMVGYATGPLSVRLRYAAWSSEQNYLVPDPVPGGGVVPGGLGQDLENTIWQGEAAWDFSDRYSLRLEGASVRNVRIANTSSPDPQPLPVTPETRTTFLVNDTVTTRLVLENSAVFGLNGKIGVEYVVEEQESSGRVLLAPGGVIQNAAAFIFEEAQFGPVTLNAGLRHDERKQKLSPARTASLAGLPTDPELQQRRYSATTAGLGASWRIGDHLVLAGNLGRAFRAPGLFELFAFGPINGVPAVVRGNANLQEEAATTLDLSARWRSDRLEASLTLYQTDFSDYITYTDTGLTAPNGQAILTYTQEDATLTGGDLEIIWRPLPDWEMLAVSERVRGEFDGHAESLPLFPADSLRLRVTRRFAVLGPAQDVRFSVGARLVADKKAGGPSEPFMALDAPGSRYGTASTEGYATFDLDASARFGDLRLSASVTNLTDEAYRDFLDIYKTIALSPGRDVRLALSWEF